VTPLRPLVLQGSPFARGAAQAGLAGVDVQAIHDTVATRYRAARDVLENPEARRYLDRQQAFAERESPAEFAETQGVCQGFGIGFGELFALLHLSALSGRYETDGCSAWARTMPDGGAILVKNRDLSGPHRNGQETFLHLDPDARGGALFCVGTLGAPGAYSSGMNDAGLALADTAIQAPAHGVGWLRYFLMTHVLRNCQTVAEARDFILSARHVGGGSLVLADAGGEVMAVELLHDGPRVESASPAFRTNHFWSEDPAAIRARLTPAALASTLGRREALEQALAAGLGLDGPDPALSAMADHGGPGREALCRHGGPDGSHTVSSVAFETRGRTVTFSRGAPCEGRRETASLDGMIATASSPTTRSA
jgi:hypothetical protein